MFKIILFTFFVSQVICDSVTYLEYGGKIPSEEAFDLWFNYNADATRDCEVALKKPSENWKTYAYKKLTCNGGTNQFKALTLTQSGATPVGTGYVIEVKFLSGTTQTGYYSANVNVQAGKQGFHVYDGRLFDANKAEFIMRGINNAHGDYDNYNRWWAYNAIPYIAGTGANTIRILWRKYGQLSTTDLDKILAKCVQSKLIPVVELHDATGSPDSGKLLEMAQWWADNVWVLTKYRKYIIVNIANEWSPYGTSQTFWRDTYKAAVSRIRNAGFSGTLLIDAPAYAQDANGPKWYGGELLNSDPVRNLVFSVHMYAEWSAQQPNYNIYNELSQLKTLKVPLVVGEFANKHPAKINGKCVEAIIDHGGIMSECQKHGFGYLGWSWYGNGNDDCGSIAYLDIATGWTTNSLSWWGNELVNKAGTGIRATSKLATVF